MRFWPRKQSLPYGPLPGKRVYAVGDIHGRADLLETLLHAIAADSEDYQGEPHLVFLGDYHNRGLDGAGVFDRLCTLPDAFSGWQVAFLKGNHELALQEFLAAPQVHTAWLNWGGYGTLESYGVAVKSRGGDLRNPSALAAELDYTLGERGHRPFIHKLLDYHVIDSLLLVHAGIRPGVPWERQDSRDLVFIREDFLARPHGLPYRVVYGHTPRQEPLIEQDKVGLDTGAYRTGRLTCGVFENQQVRFIQT